MIELSEVVSIHKILIDKFGGSAGIRDESLLSSALQRPFQTFDGQFVYKSSPERSAALVESILVNHPFIDGNKRTGYVLLRHYLLQNNLDIKASEQEKYDFIISIASAQMRFEEILAWLQGHSIPVLL